MMNPKAMDRSTPKRETPTKGTSRMGTSTGKGVFVGQMGPSTRVTGGRDRSKAGATTSRAMGAAMRGSGRTI